MRSVIKATLESLSGPLLNEAGCPSTSEVPLPGCQRPLGPPLIPAQIPRVPLRVAAIPPAHFLPFTGTDVGAYKDILAKNNPATYS